MADMNIVHFHKFILLSFCLVLRTPSACVLKMLSLLVLVCSLYYGDTLKLELAEKVSFVANNVFEPRISTAVVWWSTDSSVVTDFLINYYGSVTTIKIKGCSTTNTSEFSDAMDYKQTVFFATESGEYEYFLKNLNKTVIYPLRMLLVITVPVKKISSLQRYTKLSWENNISDILIIIANEENNITLSTYMPYGPTGCGNYNPVILKTDTSNLFPPKFTNFYGCPIKVIIANTFPYILPLDNFTNVNIRGMDMDLLDIVIKKLNAHMLKSMRRNLSGSKVFHFVVNGTYDMSLPSIILNTKRFHAAQASDVFKTLDIVLCAPNQREIYAWAKVLLPFFTNTTPLIVLSFLAFVGSIALAQRYGKYRKNVPRGVIFGTLGLFLGQGINFETKYWLNNGLFMLWIWYCTIVRIAYQGDLVDGLQKTFLEPRLKTIAQALQVVQEVGGPEGLLLNMRNSSYVNKKVEIMLWEDIPKYIKQISDGRRFLLVTDISLINHSPHKVQIVDERLPSLPQVFFMRPRWGAAKEINRRLTRMFEVGFVTKIIREYQVNPSIEVSSKVEPLAMTTVASCFIGLVIISLLLSVVLCIEIVWFKFIEKKKLH